MLLGIIALASASLPLRQYHCFCLQPAAQLPLVQNPLMLLETHLQLSLRPHLPLQELQGQALMLALLKSLAIMPTSPLVPLALSIKAVQPMAAALHQLQVMMQSTVFDGSCVNL